MRLFACHPALLFSFSCSLIVKVARIMHFFGYFQARSEPYIYSMLNAFSTSPSIMYI